MHQPFAIGCAHNNARLERDAHIQVVFSLYAIVRLVLGGQVRTVTGGDVTGILSCFQTSLVTISVMPTCKKLPSKGLHLSVLDSMIVSVVEASWYGAG